MRRDQVRFVVAITATLLLGVVGYYLTVTLRAQHHSERWLEKWGADLAPNTDQRIQNFYRVKVRDGQKVWEIAARQARYTEERGEIVVDAPQVALYFRDGESIALRCREGRVYLDTGEQTVTRMELKGNLEMQIGDVAIATQEAVYESQQHIISSPSAVQITGQGFTVAGQGYTVDVLNKRLTLNADVQAVVERLEG